MDDTVRRALSLGVGAAGFINPLLAKHAREYGEAPHYLMLFTQSHMWTNELRQEAWDRATKLRASVPQRMSMPTALATVIGDMEEDTRRRKKAPIHP